MTRTLILTLTLLSVQAHAALRPGSGVPREQDQSSGHTSRRSTPPAGVAQGTYSVQIADLSAFTNF